MALRIVGISQRFFILSKLVRADENAEKEIITLAAQARTQAADSLFPTSRSAVQVIDCHLTTYDVPDSVIPVLQAI